MNNAILENKAEVVKDGEKQLSDCCGDPLIFAMRDRFHEFPMGLFTVLECLKMAEKEGYVPELPEEWWKNIDHGYGKHFFFSERIT